MRAVRSQINICVLFIEVRPIESSGSRRRRPWREGDRAAAREARPGKNVELDMIYGSIIVSTWITQGRASRLGRALRNILKLKPTRTASTNHEWITLNDTPGREPEHYRTPEPNVTDRARLGRRRRRAVTTASSTTGPTPTSRRHHCIEHVRDDADVAPSPQHRASAHPARRLSKYGRVDSYIWRLYWKWLYYD